MRVLPLYLSILFGILSLVSAWDCDTRCPGYDVCIDEGNRRVLGPDLALLEDGLTDTGEPIIDAKSKTTKKDAKPPVAAAKKSNLRGSSDDDIDHRELQTQTLNFTYAQFKMYWEEGYCWQEEWDEREWCLECEGSSCDEGDYLQVQRCDSDDDEQLFVYEPLPQYGGGRLKPYEKQDLCWERTKINKHQLMRCSDLNDINTTQIIIGIKENGRFEMHPYGWDENTTDVRRPKCLNSHHHPKEDEIVRAEFCTLGRPSKNTRWLLINKVLETMGSGGSGGTGGGDGDPEVYVGGGSYCTASNPCPQCHGDCDDDEDCEGSLVCFERDGGDPVPSCRGGEDSPSDTDYCIDPNWVAGSGGTTTPPPTATPSQTPVTTAAPTQTPSQEPVATTSPTQALQTTPAPSTQTTPVPTTLAPFTQATPVPSTQQPSLSPGDLPPVEAVSGTFCTPTNPCPMCYGDCDEDSDCQGPLVCEERDGGQPVSGCSGGESSPSDTDYCVDPNAMLGGTTPTPTPSLPPTSAPVQTRNDTPPISISFTCSPNLPCAKCVGDCDTDDDCQENLVCFHRHGIIDTVPGCAGTDPSMTDYCVELLP